MNVDASDFTKYLANTLTFFNDTNLTQRKKKAPLRLPTNLAKVVLQGQKKATFNIYINPICFYTRNIVMHIKMNLRPNFMICGEAVNYIQRDFSR